MQIFLPFAYDFSIALADLTIQSESPLGHFGTSDATITSIRKLAKFLTTVQFLIKIHSRNFTANEPQHSDKMHKANEAFMITFTMSIQTC